MSSTVSVEGIGAGGGADGGSASHSSQVFLHCCFFSSEYFFLHFPFLQVKSFASSAHGGSASHRSQVFLQLFFFFFEYFLHLLSLQLSDLSAHGGGRESRRRAPAAKACSEGEGEGDCLRVKVEWRVASGEGEW